MSENIINVEKKIEISISDFGISNKFLFEVWEQYLPV